MLTFPKGFGKQLDKLHSQIKAHASRTNDKSTAQTTEEIEIPKPRILFNAGKEKSRAAHMQVERVLESWRAQIQRQNLAASRISVKVTRPFDLELTDVAERHTAAGTTVVENPAVRVVYLGADRRVLSGRRFVRGRERTRYARDTSIESGTADRNCLGQAADGHDIQHRHRGTQSGEPGLYSPLCNVATKPVAHCRCWRESGIAAVIVSLLVALGPFADVGPVQRAVPRMRGFCTKLEGRPILSHAAAASEHAAHDAADGAGHGVEFGQ